MKHLTVVFIGGTQRALVPFRYLAGREEVDIKYAVFMKGHPDEVQYAEQLETMAQEHHIPYIVSDKITRAVIDQTRSIGPDVIIGGGVWRSMIPSDFFNIPPYGAIGLHGSALPQYRGWAGINWYMINGEKEYRMRMFQVDGGLDSGPLVADRDGNFLEVGIGLENEKHIAEILDEFPGVQVKAYGQLVDILLKGDVQFIPQDESAATYTCHRGPEDGEIDWSRSTREVFNFIRAQSRPYPGAFTFFNGHKVILWRVKPRYDYANYVGRIHGKVVTRDKDADSVVILTGDGGIEVLEAGTTGNGKTGPTSIFDSVRKRCKSKIEAFMETMGFDGAGVLQK